MSATDEVRDSARLFGWSQHVTQDQHDILVRGDRAVDILYSIDGSVHSAQLYRFFSINNMELREHTPERHKKATVLAWLAA